MLMILSMAQGNVCSLRTPKGCTLENRYIKEENQKANTSSHGVLQILLYSLVFKRKDGVVSKYVQMTENTVETTEILGDRGKNFKVSGR
jgi:hypothetical protein